MEEKRSEIQRQFSRRILKFSGLMFALDLLGAALLILGARHTDSARLPLMIAALAVFFVTGIINLVVLRRLAAERDEQLRQLEARYQPLEDWTNQSE